LADFVAPPNVAVIGNTVLDVTAVVVIVNVADVLPAATVTVAGGEATVALPLVSMTIAPPAGAAPFNVTVLRVVEWPPTTVAGESRRELSAGAFTVRLAVLVTPS
jgi:hypothetical protein